MSGKFETIADVVNDMKALTRNSFTSSPTSSPKKTFEDDSSDISIDDSHDKTRETTPVKSDNRLLKSLRFLLLYQLILFLCILIINAALLLVLTQMRIIIGLNYRITTDY